MSRGLTVVLVHPGTPPADIFERLGRSDLPPLGILYVAAALIQAGHDVEVIDLNLATSGSDVVSRIVRSSPHVVGLGTIAPSEHDTLRLARRLREVMPADSLLIAGGADATIRTDHYTGAGLFDAVLVGEAEQTLPRMLEAWPDVPAMRGVIPAGSTEGEKADAVNPDDSPFPARQLVPLRQYRGGPAYKRDRHSTSIFTHRGCPFQCSFCEKAVHEGPVRYRSVHGVLEEIRHIRRTFGIRDIRFIDDVLMARRDWFHEFLDAILASGERFRWLTTGRVDLVDDETLRKMRAAGCYRIEYGLESGSDRVLAMVDKGVTTATIRRAVEATRRAGIESIGNFILGFPTETEAEMLATLDLAVELDPDYAIFFPFCPYEGAEICEQFDLGWDPSMPVFRAASPAYLVTTERVLQLVDQAYTRFYFRSRGVGRRIRAMRSPWVAWDLARMGAVHLGKRLIDG